MAKQAEKVARECETITLAQACRRIGISLPTATKLLEKSPNDFPPAFWIGGRRYVLRRSFEDWFAGKTGQRLSSPA